MRILPSQGRPIYTLAFSPDGRLLAAGDGEELNIWDVAAGAVSAQVESRDVRIRRSRTLEVSLALKCARFSPDGEWLAIGSPNCAVRRWHIASQDFVQPYGPRYGDSLEGLAVAPNSQMIALACGNIVRQCTVPNLTKPIAFLDIHSIIFALAYSPDGHALAIGAGSWGRFGKVSLNWGAGLTTVDLPGHRGPVLSVAFSPDSRLLASGSSDRTIRLWDVRRTAMLGVLEGHTDVVRCVAFSADGRTLTSVSWDGTVKLWDVHSQRERTTFAWHTGMVHAVAFAPDGMTAATAGQDGAIVIWDVDC